MQGLMTTAQLAEYLSIGRTYVYERRISGDWLQGVHWIYVSPKNPRKGVRYQPDLCLNWMLNQSQPEKHQEFIEAFLPHHSPSSLPNAQTQTP